MAHHFTAGGAGVGSAHGGAGDGVVDKREAVRAVLEGAGGCDEVSGADFARGARCGVVCFGSSLARQIARRCTRIRTRTVLGSCWTRRLHRAGLCWPRFRCVRATRLEKCCGGLCAADPAGFWRGHHAVAVRGATGAGAAGSGVFRCAIWRRCWPRRGCRSRLRIWRARFPIAGRDFQEGRMVVRKPEART